MKQERRAAKVAGVDEIQVDGLANDARIVRDRRADEIGCQF